MKQRFKVLDIFRGLFSFCVVLFHLSNSNKSFLVANSFIIHAYLFVDFFFVLSGFVIAYKYDKMIRSFADARQYITKRFYRLYPLHFFTLVFFVIYYFGRIAIGQPITGEATEAFTLNLFINNLFLVNSIQWCGVNLLSWNIPSWSISAEFISYVSYALVLLIVQRNRLKPYVFLLIISSSLYFIYNLNSQSHFDVTYDNGFLRGLAGFFTGTLCHWVYTRMNLVFVSRRLYTILEIFAFCLIALVIYYGNIFARHGFIYELLFFISILIFSFEKGLLSHLLQRSRLLSEFGKLSYSIYMNHYAVIIVLSIVLKHWTGKNAIIDTAYVLLVLLITYVVSLLTYKFIEKRFY